MRTYSALLITAMCVVLGSTIAAASEDVWYVNKNQTANEADGRSWETAFREIQPAIDAAYESGGGEVWVAAGVYDEERVSDMDSGSIDLRQGVELYGGFSGGEQERAERDFEENETVLDGSEALDGSPAQHVVFVTGDSKIDGFTITGGRARLYKAESPPLGGGIYNPSPSDNDRGSLLTVRNSRFYDNQGRTGAGIYGTVDLVENCHFENHKEGTDTNVSGAAIWLPPYHKDDQKDDSSVPRFEIRSSTFSNNPQRAVASSRRDGPLGHIHDCVFTENGGGPHIPYGGGAVSNVVEVRDSVFENNSQDHEGGAVAEVEEMHDSHFEGNSAKEGGAIWDADVVEGCTFVDNHAEEYGGAISGAREVRDSVFIGNTADERGGAINPYRDSVITGCRFEENEAPLGGAIGGHPSLDHVRGFYLRVENSLFARNAADKRGGAIYLNYTDDGSPMSPAKLMDADLVNVTFSGNTAGEEAGAIWQEGHRTRLNYHGLFNAIVWGNSEPQLSGVSFVGHAIVGDQKPDPDTNVVDDDPLFANPEEGDYRLSPESPARDAGQLSFDDAPSRSRAEDAPLEDIEGRSRPRGEGIDLGPYEYEAEEAVVVTVPDVEEIPQAEAETLLEEADLTVGSVEMERSDEVTEGEVIAQSVRGGANAIAGDAVDLVVSEGRATGDLRVTIEPEEANEAGAAWFLEHIPRFIQTPRYSGDTAEELEPGEYTVEFRELEDWVDPEPQTVTVKPDETTEVNAAYRDEFGITHLEDPDEGHPLEALSLGGNLVHVHALGLTDDTAVYIGDERTYVTEDSDIENGLLAVETPGRAPGEYELRLVDKETGQEHVYNQRFSYGANPFEMGTAQFAGEMREIRDTPHGVSIAAGSMPGSGRWEDWEEEAEPLEYETPEGVKAEIPAEALPEDVDDAFVVVRSATNVEHLFEEDVALPEGETPRSPYVDVHILVERGGETGELAETADAPITLRLPPTLAPEAWDELSVGLMVTNLDEQFQPLLPDPAEILRADELEVTFDDKDRAVVEVEHLTAYGLLGPEVPGDVTGNGVVNARDIQLVTNKVLGLPVDERYDTDQTKSGDTDARDIQKVINAVLGIE